ncbi:hypothetical protein BJY04DRAFT_198522 [Aspergillus karnatakaensis]|uniref:uncharacterized protein n=1 Tax=Aspergillus karnatakaensis TaxID=1810916 RepID=UPI003CCCCDA4
MTAKLEIVLTTTLSLVEQFQSTLASPQANPQPTTSEQGKDLDPLPLLSASSTALKSHVTKLSLVAINSPFTPSVVSTTLSTLNESVLPSLVTAALLVTPESHTKAFQTEICVNTSAALKELYLLVREVQVVAQEKADKKSLEQSDKITVTVAAGRVWDACDVLTDVATKGVIGFVVRRAQQYRDLVRDAVEEIEAWDPDEEEDEFFDDLLSDGERDPGDKGKDGGGTGSDEDDGEEESATLHSQKKDTLRILKPVAQIYPAIISNRLKKAPALLTPANIRALELLLKSLQQIPDHIDEVAGALYEVDFGKLSSQLGKTKMCANRALDLVVMPWNTRHLEAEDKFTTWCQTWTKVMEEVTKSIDESSRVRSN